MNPDWQKYAEKDAWLGAKQDRKRRTRVKTARRGNGRKWGLVAFVAILAATTAVVVVLGRDSRAGSSAAPTAVNPTSVAAIAHVDLARPYANTPADVWKKGLEGITSPAPAAVGKFKADAVAAAYEKVRQAISAARLDPAVLYQHDTKNYVAVFAPDMQDYMRPVIASKPKNDGTPDFSSYVTEVADGYHLLDQGPRTFGTLTARAGEKPGELIVEAKIVIAYAFDNVHPEGLTHPGEIVSFQRTDESYLIRSGTSFAKTSVGLWLTSGDTALSSGGCEAAKQGFLAPGYTNANLTATGPDVDKEGPGYYDPQYAVPNLDTCPK